MVAYRGISDRNIVPMIGRMKVHDVKQPEVAGMMKKMPHKSAEGKARFQRYAQDD